MLIERARREIQIATDTAVKDLYNLSGKLATDIASRPKRTSHTGQNNRIKLPVWQNSNLVLG